MAEIPVNLIHEPWKLNMIEQQFCQLRNRKDYPAPIVNVKKLEGMPVTLSGVSVKDRSERGRERMLKSMFPNPNRKTRKTKF
jgi:deoxyribodipyrimidine photo-lyase